MEVNNYYPYGLLNSSLSYSRSGNRYKYQTKEVDNYMDYNILDFGARHYDPATARWTAYDPASQYATPYIAMGGNPVSGIDPDGRKSNSYQGSANSSDLTQSKPNDYVGDWFESYWARAGGGRNCDVASYYAAMDFATGAEDDLGIDASNNLAGSTNAIFWGRKIISNMYADAGLKVSSDVLNAASAAGFGINVSNNLSILTDNINSLFGDVTIDNINNLGTLYAQNSGNTTLKDVTVQFMQILYKTKLVFSGLYDYWDSQRANYNSLTMSKWAYGRATMFGNLVKTNSAFDLKNRGFAKDLIGERSNLTLNGLTKSHRFDFYGNFNYGVAAYYYGYTLDVGQFSAGAAQLYSDFGSWKFFTANRGRYGDRWGDGGDISQGFNYAPFLK